MGVADRRRGIVRIHFTQGFGNNIFQYVFCRLFASKNLLKLSCSRSLPIGVKKKKFVSQRGVKTKIIRKISCSDKKVWRKYLKGHWPNDKNYNFIGYFEDYVLYKPYLKKIRSWFDNVNVGKDPNRHDKDLVLHLRLGNRLVQTAHKKNLPSIDSYEKVINSFKFDKLYIVTNCRDWRHLSSKDVKKIRRKNPPVRGGFVSVEKSVAYMNDMVDLMSQYNFVVRSRLKYIKDFNFIRSFNQIIMTGSTFAWWAAVLGGANNVAVYGPWKPSRGKKRNKNLGQTNYTGWSQWE